MSRSSSGQTNPWLLFAMGVALIAAAFFFYTDHPVRESMLYAPLVPGWISVGMFILIGVARYAIGMHDRERQAKAKREARGET
jgi:Na+/melibiose symporter-like transporter